MVLTNYEMWAADSSSVPDGARLEFERTMARSRQLNPFNPSHHHHHQQHLSSNGYYGYSYIVSAHEVAINNNDDNNNNNDNHINNNNNMNTPNLMAITNDLNNIHNIQAGTGTGTGTSTSAITKESNFLNTVNGDFVYNTTNTTETNYTNINMYEAQKRNKKRQFIMNYDNDDIANTDHHHINNYNLNICNNVNTAKYAKRCRYDDNCAGYYKNHQDLSAEYCNDFFNLPSTQIATQSCFMDIEDNTTSPASSTTVATQLWNYNNNNCEGSGCSNSNNNTDDNNNNNFENLQPQQQQQQLEQEHLYGVNRDVSRCMSSHMI